MTRSPSPDRLPFSGSGPGPLGPDVDPGLRDLDARVGARLRSDYAAPAGLSDRVFAASASLLPRPMRSTTRWASRLAVAAAVGLAFTVAVICLQPPQSPDHTIASADPVPVPSVGPLAPSLDPDMDPAMDLEWLAMGPVDALDREVRWLIDSGGASYDELRGELLEILEVYPEATFTPTGDAP